jgi:hypothetical protein
MRCEKEYLKIVESMKRHSVISMGSSNINDYKCVAVRVRLTLVELRDFQVHKLGSRCNCVIVNDEEIHKC